MKRKLKNTNIQKDEEDSHDSDDAPEEVAFSTGLEKMLQKKRSVTKQLEQDKEKLKIKRKHQDELFKEQKRQKLERLESMKLPDDILENVTKSSKKSKEPPTKNEEIVKKQNKNPDEEENDDSSNDNDEQEEKNNSSYDFISFDKSTGIKVVYAADIPKITPAFVKARDFQNNSLFGRGTKRQSVKTYLSVCEKRRVRRT